MAVLSAPLRSFDRAFSPSDANAVRHFTKKDMF